MKSLWIYVIIGSTAFAVGATGGIIGKRFIAAAKTQYIGEIETMDIEDLMKRYNQNPNQNFTPAEMINIAMEKYRTCENCYSVSKGTANTVVNQTIRNYQIKNGDDYFEESISRSSMVKLADRMTQHGKEGDIKFYHGKADSEEVGSYPSDPKVYNQEDYTNFLGRTLNQMFIYVITDNTVLDDGTKVEKTKDGSKGNKSSASNKVEVKKSNPTYDVFMKWLFDIRHALRTSSSMKKIWGIDKTLCIETILQNKDVANFLVSHISFEKLDKLAK